MKPTRVWVRNQKPSFIWDGLPVYGYTQELLTAGTIVDQQYRPRLPDFESVLSTSGEESPSTPSS